MNGSGFHGFHALRVVLLLLCASACATPAHRAIQKEQAVAPSASVPGVPFVPQLENHCGPASLAMVMGWGGLSASTAELAAMAFTPGKEGALQADMLGAARRKGFLAVRVRDLRGLLTELRGGHPVVVLLNLGYSWYPRWHYAVAIGYDLSEGWVALHSGREEATRMEIDLFERTWRRSEHWALAILPPGRLPVSAGESETLEAASALERIGHGREAKTAYRAVLTKWPHSVGAWFGLGNASAAEGDLKDSVEAFQQALELSPSDARIWFNLAQVQHRAGRRSKSSAAARRALELADAVQRERFEAELRPLLAP